MKSWCLIVVLLLTCALGCASVKSMLGGEDDKEVPLSEVPTPALQAAQGAVDGVILTEAEMDEEDGRTVYDIEGTANGVEYEIEVTADGKVLEVEQEDDDDGDDDDDHGEEEGDD